MHTAYPMMHSSSLAPIHATPAPTGYQGTPTKAAPSSRMHFKAKFFSGSGALKVGASLPTWKSTTAGDNGTTNYITK